MIFKTGVSGSRLDYRLKMFLVAIDFLHKHFFGKEIVVTSTFDGSHMRNSLHYSNLAVDIRSSDKTFSQSNSFVNSLKFWFDDFLDIVLEEDHIHIEYDPK